MTSDRRWLDHYAPGVPSDATIPEGSVVDLLRSACDRFPDRAALEFFGATTTYREFWDAVLQAAGALHAAGVRTGDRVALVLPNCPQHVVAFYGALRLGAVVVEHNPLYTQEELGRQFADHSPRVVIAWDSVAASASAVLPNETKVFAVDLTRALPATKQLALRLPLRKSRATRAAMTQPAPGIASWDRLVASAAPIDASVPAPSAGDVALLQYTGGTTGIPKGAILTHRNLVANAAQSAAWAPDLAHGEETIYAVLPLFHVYGLTLCFTTAVMIGATVVLFPRFDPDLVLDAMQRRPATFLPGVPPMYPRLVARARERNIPLTSVKIALAGAMALPPETVTEWEAATGGLLIEGYGMTETSPISIGNPIAANRRPGCIGVPYPSTDIRIVDPDDPQTEVVPGEPGELLVHGPQVFSGYWNRPDDTAASLLEGDWVRTGDVVVQDDDGFIRIVDRIKELIIVGGFNVYPSEVEAVLMGMPGVAEAAVVSLPGSSGGEQVAAAIVAAPGQILDPEQLRAECRSHLAAYKVPKQIVIIDELPRSTIGKVLRASVRAQLLNS